MEVEEEEEVGRGQATTLTLPGYMIKEEGPERQEDQEEKQTEKKELVRLSLEFV